jgi:solute carrier family 25 (mitochondrial phosphate transporter), member 3
MVMFSTFEHAVDFLYQKVIQRRKEDCSKAQQLGVTCLAGYAAGSFGSIISNPADNIVASVYNKKANSLQHVISIFDLLLRPQMLSFHLLASSEFPGSEENWAC